MGKPGVAIPSCPRGTHYLEVVQVKNWKRWKIQLHDGFGRNKTGKLTVPKRKIHPYQSVTECYRKAGILQAKDLACHDLYLNLPSDNEELTVAKG